MAKQKKSGLGRGLNSLLSIEEEPISTETKEQTQPKEEKPEKETKKEDTKKKKQSTQARTEEINSNIEEDNVIIKSITERETSASKTSNAKPKPSKGGAEKVKEIDIDLIYPNPNQPRTSFKSQELSELADSIKQKGLLQPIIVRKKDNKYEIVAGERRWQACKSAKLKKVPVHIVEADDNETIMLALIENIQRSDLNPIEEAYGYKRMMERGKMTQTQVAQAVSKGRSTIANSLRLLELPEEAQELLFEDRITAGHARAILSIPSKEGREKLTNKLKNKQLSVRETESIARLMSGKKDDQQQNRPNQPKFYKTAARSLSDILQTDVRVKSSKGKNKIEISFKDEADLERLFRIITSE